MLQNLKQILGITGNEKDGLLQFVLDTVTDEVMNYCNITEIPPQLERVISRMAADMWRSEGYGQETKDPVVKSVSRGDESTSFDTSVVGKLEGSKSIIDDYVAQLNAYRKLRW